MILATLLTPTTCLLLLTSLLLFFYSLTHSLPRIFMRYILSDLAKPPTPSLPHSHTHSYNTIQHLSKRTHEHRSIVIPCPDILYSTVPCDFTHSLTHSFKHPSNHSTTALLIKAPASVYSSLGIYDDSASCVDIISHSGQELRVVIVGPTVVGCDEDILRALNLTAPLGNNTGVSERVSEQVSEQGSERVSERVSEELAGECAYIVRRMPTSRGLLLHRLLTPNPDKWEDMEKLQVSEVSCVSTRLPPSCHEALMTPHATLPTRLLNAMSVYVHTPTALPCFIVIVSVFVNDIMTMEKDVVSSVVALRLSVIILGMLCGVMLAVVTLKQLKKPRVVQWTNLMRLERVGQWSFNALDTTDPTGPLGVLGQPLAHLIFFLHGALGLLPSEVYYAAATTALESPPRNEHIPVSLCECVSEHTSNNMVTLQPGESYVIDVSTLDLNCAWWSITVYGGDLFLVPNEVGVYSVNSFQLQEAAAKQSQVSEALCVCVCARAR
jgi:hypothetical protein